MFFNRVSLFSSFVIAGLLTACGGGGGGGDSPSAVSTTTTFPIAQAYSQILINGYQGNISLSGTAAGASVTGNGTYQITPAAAATFENQSGLKTKEIISVTAFASGQTIPISISSQTFYDSNYNEIGSTSDDFYVVSNAPFALPQAAHVNDSGTLGTATNYDDSTKTVVDGTITALYKVENESASSVIFVVTAQHYNVAHTLDETDVYRYRITSSAVATLLSIAVTTTDGTLTFTFK